MPAPGIDIFGTAPDASPVYRLTLENGGARVSLFTWGASLQAFHVADHPDSIVLGSPDFAAYLGPLKHCGAIVDRVANRIAGGRAMLDGSRLNLDRNEQNRACLHGGSLGASPRNWQIANAGDTGATLTLRLADGEGGFSGNLDTSAPTLHGTPYAANAGFAVEPQHWSDAPNHPDYPDIRLNPGETYCQVSRFHAHRAQGDA